MNDETIPRLLDRRAKEWGGRPALRRKVLGAWQTITWAEQAARVRALARGLAAYGINRGDVVALLAENGPDWLACDMAAQAIGAISQGLYPEASAARTGAALRDSGAVAVIVGNDEQLDKVLAETCPALRLVIVIDGANVDAGITTLRALLARGAGHAGWEQCLAAGSPDDIAVLADGQRLSHRDLLARAAQVAELVGGAAADEQLSFLPLSELPERLFTTLLPLWTGAAVSFAESLDTVGGDLREVRPSVLQAVPRVWEKIHAGVALRLNEATGLGRLACRLGLAAGAAVAAARLDGRRPGLGLAICHRLADLTVLANLRRMLGLDLVRRLVSVSGPVAPELADWYQALGCDFVDLEGRAAGCEASLCASPYIADAVVVDGSCLVLIDEDNVIQFAQGRALPFSGFAGLVRLPEVAALVGAEIARLDAGIRAFRLLDRRYLPGDDELTPAMRLDRRLIIAAHAPLFEAMRREAA